MRAIALLIVISLSACQRADVPTNDFLVDEAGLLTRAQVEHIRDYHERLLRDLDVHFKVAILKESPPDIEETGVQLFHDYSLGSRTKGAKGLLLIIDPEGRQTRIETGYDLEPIFADVFTSYIQREQMAPFYQSGQVAEGIEATVELLVTRAAGAIDSGAYDPDLRQTPVQQLSGGGGANVRLDAAQREPAGTRRAPSSQTYDSQPSVDAAFSTYLRVLENRIKEPRLGIYSSETQRFLATRVVTDAQQANELTEIQAVYGGRTIRESGDLAVVLFSESKRVPPYFFRRRGVEWTIDLSVMGRVIGFDTLNQWYVRDKNSEFSPLLY